METSKTEFFHWRMSSLLNVTSACGSHDKNQSQVTQSRVCHVSVGMKAMNRVTDILSDPLAFKV